MLAVDLVVVFLSVIYRYVLNNPLQWTDEIGRALLVALTFLGGAAALSRRQHMGVVALTSRLRGRPLAFVESAVIWIVLIFAVVFLWFSAQFLRASFDQTTASGLSQAIFFIPMTVSAAAMVFHAVAAFSRSDRRSVVIAALTITTCGLIWWAWGVVFPGTRPAPFAVMLIGFVIALVLSVPVGFALGISSLLFLWTKGGINMQIIPNRMEAGVDNFVLLAIPFFVLAGFIMEVSGMSGHLVNVVSLIVGRLRGGLGIVMIISMYLFSGISGSKTADVTAVGSFLIPTMRKERYTGGEAVSILAASAAMGETVPPSLAIIILGYTANLSISGLFIAGILPAAAIAVLLMLVAFVSAPARVEQARKPRRTRREITGMIIGALLALLVPVMILGGILKGIATPTEISGFAVVYALCVAWFVYRNVGFAKTVKLFVESAVLSGMILFIVATASLVGWILTAEGIPQSLARTMIAISAHGGTWVFLVLSVLVLILMGSVLEGGPALIIFGPLLVPIAAKLGVNPLHYGIVLIIAMGIGLFSPPIGIGLYTACAVGGVSVEQASRPLLKYLVVLIVGLLLIAFVPWITLVLPRALGVGGS